MALRLLVAAVLGAAVGLERERRRRPAGVRTFMLVALGSALFTVVSIFGFGGPITDPSRVAAQIVTGIGFIGAGVVFRSGTSVFGLTTAASIWAVAAIGMASGVGLYGLAIIATALVLFVLYLVHRWEEIFERRRSDQTEQEEE
ncbi:MAG: MgtC/SapB family protein [Chloroflexi bacterium]|nr:MgtC/SapB family protein [Chloroflexota bacterium]